HTVLDVKGEVGEYSFIISQEAIAVACACEQAVLHTPDGPQPAILILVVAPALHYPAVEVLAVKERTLRLSVGGPAGPPQREHRRRPGEARQTRPARGGAFLPCCSRTHRSPVTFSG